MSALANFLREQLRARGWSQTDLAAEAGLPKTTVSRLLNDRVDEPELSTLMKLSVALEIPLIRLIELAGFPVEAPAPPAAQHQRLTILAESLPWLTPIVEQLAALEPADLESVLTYLEVLRQRRRPDQTA
jgi:transcriptional regulator with XRE-family HTH domain